MITVLKALKGRSEVLSMDVDKIVGKIFLNNSEILKDKVFTKFRV